MKPATYSKTSIDIFLTQISWTFWFLGITLLVHLVRIIFQSSADSYYSTGYISTNIYMLVIGIITISFLTYYVENGITRKNYFYGNAIASIGLSIVIPILIYALNLAEKFIINKFTSTVINENVLGEALEEVAIDMNGNIIGEIIQSFIFSPSISPASSLLLSLALFSLNIFVFYIIGWLIGAAFKRLGVIGGILFIFIGLAIAALKDSMIRLAMDLPLLENFSFLNIIPDTLALPIVLVLIVVTFIFIRLLTKKTPIKI